MKNWKEQYAKDYEGERFYGEVFVGGEYKEAKERAEALGRKVTIIDVGALAGEFSFYMYDYADKIYAIEPHPESFAELDRNVKKYGLKKIKPFKLALADKNGQGELKIGERGGHSLIHGGEEKRKVKVKTLATFMKENGIEHVDILKIDIEGGEIAVFDSPDFDKVADKIDFILGEHSSCNGRLEPLGFEYPTQLSGIWVAKRN